MAVRFEMEQKKRGFLMGNMTLSKLQKEQYKEIVQAFEGNNTIMLDDKDYIRLRETLGILELLGYIRNIEVDNTNMFLKIGEFSDFDKWHKDKEREERKISAREWKIAIVSVIIGGLIGLIPFIMTTVIPWIISLIEKQ